MIHLLFALFIMFCSPASTLVWCKASIAIASIDPKCNFATSRFHKETIVPLQEQILALKSQNKHWELQFNDQLTDNKRILRELDDEKSKTMQLQAQLNEEISSLHHSLEVVRESHAKKLQALHLQTVQQLQVLLEAHQRQLYDAFVTGVVTCIFVVLMCLVFCVIAKYLCGLLVSWWSKWNYKTTQNSISCS